MSSLGRRLRARVPAGDAGMTLIELMVGMLIMVIFMAIFTGAIVSMASTANKVEAVTTSSAQTNNAFLSLDKTVRYAGAITTSGTGASGNWYVELDAVNSDTAVETCTQLRVDIASQQLQQRTWSVTGVSSYTSLSAWQMIANKITNGAAAAGAADQPFTAPTALTVAATSFQRLTVTLVAAAAATNSTTTARSNMTFTALNSIAAATTNSTACQQLGQAGRP